MANSTTTTMEEIAAEIRCCSHHLRMMELEVMGLIHSHHRRKERMPLRTIVYILTILGLIHRSPHRRKELELMGEAETIRTLHRRKDEVLMDHFRNLMKKTAFAVVGLHILTILVVAD
jgi:hypothetical protein